MEKTLRDELAMSFDIKSIPFPTTPIQVEMMASKMGLEYELKNPLKMTEFYLKLESIIRYMYADEMLKVRGV